MTSERREPEPAVGNGFVVARQMRPTSTSPLTVHGDQDLFASGADRREVRVVPVTDMGPTRPFTQVLQDRRSIRNLDPPSVDEVGTVLARCGLTREGSSDSAGQPIFRRPNPSAGGRHPLSLVLLANDVMGLPGGEWVLDPDAAALRQGSHGVVEAAEALDKIGEAAHVAVTPVAAIVVVAHPQRTLTKYPGGISLIWRDAGALLMLAHLAATDLSLGSCIVGTPDFDSCRAHEGVKGLRCNGFRRV